MSISERALAAAVEQGVISAEQAVRLGEVERGLSASGAEPEDDEKLRFVTGFGDVFVTLGLGLFLGAASYFLFNLGGTLLMWGGLAALAWALAEFFTRVRRMALPSIALLVTFAVAAFVLAYFSIAPLLGVGDFRVYAAPDDVAARPIATTTALAGVAAAALIAVHYWRFRVPITIAAGVAALVCAVVAALTVTAPALMYSAKSVVILALGIAVFGLAMHFDTSDRERVTRRTDIAFWLHLIAAPMIVHPLVATMFGADRSPGLADAIGVLAIFFALGAVAVLIDRRALLVSGLTYAGIAFASLLREVGLSDQVAPATMLVLGAFVLLLSAGWHALRRTSVALLPERLRLRLPVVQPVG